MILSTFTHPVFLTYAPESTYAHTSLKRKTWHWMTFRTRRNSEKNFPFLISNMRRKFEFPSGGKSFGPFLPRMGYLISRSIRSNLIMTLLRCSGANCSNFEATFARIISKWKFGKCSTLCAFNDDRCVRDVARKWHVWKIKSKHVSVLGV